MKRTWLLALLIIPLLPSLEARADVVSDRVLLTTGPATCGTNALGFHRVKQVPDGSQTIESGEFQVPSGSYLEILDVEYATPYSTAWAKTYVQSLDVSIRQRIGTATTSVLSAKYQNQSVYGESGDNYAEIGELVGPGAQTHAIAFPTGPLMSSAARLCAAPTTRDFWLYGGSVIVRGRLISTGEVFTAPSSTTNSP